VFRTEEYLEACLSSLVRQTFTDFEVIVVDDASPGGGAAEIVQAVGDQRITLIRHIENLGLMQARFTGVRAARGPYVGFVDSDDEVDERFLEVLHDAAMQHGADMVQCAILVHEVDGTSWCVNRGGEGHDLRAGQVLKAMLAGSISNNLCNKLVKTELLLAVYDELSTLPKRVDYGEDLITAFGLASRADRFAHVPDPVYRYRLHVLSMTGKSDAASLFAKVESLSWIFDQIRPALTRRAEPPDLVEELFTREFLEPIVAHLKRAREQGVLGPTGSPTSPAELGLLGTVIADAYGMYDTRSEPDDRSASSPQ
jgi:glycosyltransferase involved in cell wall biosynthesis